MSTKTGFAPCKAIMFTVEAKVMDGVIISSPGAMFSAESIIYIPAVAEFTDTAC